MFGSDNQSGASSQVTQALTDAFTQTTDTAYGDDQFCADAARRICERFETEAEVFFAVSGTASNTLALSALVQPWEGIICHHQAHILLDESSAPALITGGAAMLPMPVRELRMTPADLHVMLDRLPNEPPHNIRPKALSISQASECGQVYTVDEVRALCSAAKSAGLSVHMDGARFANAVAALDCSPAEVTWKAGVDVLCLGATKNGAIAAEAVVFFNRELAADFDYRLKRTGHLVSKGRLFGAQFNAWLKNDHWLDLAHQANHMAEVLRAKISASSSLRLAFPCESNETFVILQKSLHKALLSQGAEMFDWYPDALPPEIDIRDDELLARMVTSFATQPEHINQFFDLVQRLESA